MIVIIIQFFFHLFVHPSIYSSIYSLMLIEYQMNLFIHSDLISRQKHQNHTNSHFFNIQGNCVCVFLQSGVRVD